MGREDDDIRAAKLGYKKAARDGNRDEEARWGEYFEALRWLQIDYEISTKCLPQEQLLASCQSLGDLHLRQECFREALLYQGQALAKINVGEVLDSSGDSVWGTKGIQERL